MKDWYTFFLVKKRKEKEGLDHYAFVSNHMEVSKDDRVLKTLSGPPTFFCPLVMIESGVRQIT